MSEVWRDILGFGGAYQVSSIGRFRRAVPGAGGTYAGRILKVRPDAFGYMRATLRDATGAFRRVSAHVAMLEAFVGPRPDKYDASHLNGVRTDNRLENLRWESSSDNHRRKFEHGTLIHGELHKCSKLKREQVMDIRLRVGGGEKKASLAREYGVSRTLVGYIVSGRAWPHIEAQQ